MKQATETVDPLAPLSKRERLVARQSAAGLTYREIADALFIAPNTVRSHISTIYKKLGIRNKAALIHLLGNEAAGSEKSSHLVSVTQPPPICPYPGMMPFRAEDAAYFYGREAEIEQMVQQLSQQRRLMVIGPSGSGKSSLVYAGLLPALTQSHYFDDNYWLIHPLRPGPRPLSRLAERLAMSPEEMVLTDDSIQSLLYQHPPAQRLLLLIDQFEEIFTQAERCERNRFMDALQALETVERCVLLLTLRADFYPDLMSSSLWPVAASQRVEIAPLRGQALRAAIEKPATTVGVHLEDSLVNRLLSDAADEPGVLPLLQETMGQLWLQMEQRVLSYSDYENLSHNSMGYESAVSSGLTVAIAMKADTTLAKLTPAQQLIARRIFLRLIQFGEGRADTRRQQPLSALQAVGDKANEFDRTLEHLTDHRLLTRSGDNDEDDSHVDIAHESLISGWSQLHDWIEQRREAEQIRRRLEGKAAEWVRLGKASGGLLDDAELPEAERWLASADAEDLGFDATLPELVEASQLAIEEAEQAREAARQQKLAQAAALAEEQQQRIAEQIRAAGRMRRLMIGLTAVFFIAVGAALLAWTQSQKADVRRIEAENARLASIAQLLLIQAPQQQAVLADERGALLARQAYHFSAAGSRRLQEQVDDVLRTVVGKPRFSSILRQQWSSAVAFSPNGTHLVSAISGNVLTLWDLNQPHAQPMVLPGLPTTQGVLETIYTLAFSPNGKTLLAANANGSIGQWDLTNLQEPMVARPRQKGGVWSAAYSRDGRWLALGSQFDDTFVLWDLNQPKNDALVVNDPLPTTGRSRTDREKLGGVPVAFSPDSTTLATGSLNGDIRLWQLDDLSAPISSLRGHEGELLVLAFYNRGRYLASSGQDKTIRLWNLEQPLVAPIIVDNGASPAVSLAFGVDDSVLVSAGISTGIQLWRVNALDSAPVKIAGGRANKVAFSPDGKHMASAGSAVSHLRLWDLEPSGQIQVLTNHHTSVTALAFNPDGTRLASGGSTGDGTIRLWRWDALSAPPTVINGHNGQINSLSFSADAKQLLSASYDDNTVRLWSLDQSASTFTDLAVPDSFVPWTARFSPDGTTVAATGFGGVFTWELNDLNADATSLLPSDRAGGLAFNPNGKAIVMGNKNGDIYWKNLARPERAASVLRAHSSNVWSVVFSPNGQALASGSLDGTVRLWKPATPDSASVVLGSHDDIVLQVQFSPDGKQLASVSQDHSVKLWNVDNPKAVPIVLSGHEDAVRSLAYSPDGQHLVTGSRDKTIRVWDLTHPLNASTTQVIADKVCEKVLRNLTLDEWHKFIGADIPYERTCANLPIHPSLFETAEKQAKAGEKEGAVALLERALELDSELKLKPQKTVDQWVKPDEQ